MGIATLHPSYSASANVLVGWVERSDTHHAEFKTLLYVQRLTADCHLYLLGLEIKLSEF